MTYFEERRFPKKIPFPLTTGDVSTKATIPDSSKPPKEKQKRYILPQLKRQRRPLPQPEE